MYDHYMEYCAFTDDERTVLDRCRKGHSITKIQMEMTVSRSWVDDRIRDIKRKIEEENRLNLAANPP